MESDSVSTTTFNPRDSWVEVRNSSATRMGRVDLGSRTDRPACLPLNDRLEWMNYLARLAAENQISQTQKSDALSLWGMAREQGMPLPRASCADHTLLMTWQRGRRHFSIELGQEGLPEWSYSDLRTGAYDGGEIQGGRFSPEALELLQTVI